MNGLTLLKSLAHLALALLLLFCHRCHKPNDVCPSLLVSSLPWTSYEAQASYEVNFGHKTNFLADDFFYVVLPSIVFSVH
jgi:hypothetical protein